MSAFTLLQGQIAEAGILQSGNKLKKCELNMNSLTCTRMENVFFVLIFQRETTLHQAVFLHVKTVQCKQRTLSHNSHSALTELTQRGFL